MENIVINIVNIVGEEDDVKNAIMMLLDVNPIKEITKTIGDYIGYKGAYDNLDIIKWDINGIPFEFELNDNNSIKFKTYYDMPYESILELSIHNPDVHIKLLYADEEFGFNTGMCEFYQGEEIDYYVPNNIPEAVKFSLNIIDDNYYIFEYICDLDDEDLEDGINGSDEVLNTLLHHIYTKQILSDIYPIQLQEYLLELAVEEENYEFAAELKKVLDSAY